VIEFDGRIQTVYRGSRGKREREQTKKMHLLLLVVTLGTSDKVESVTVLRREGTTFVFVHTLSLRTKPTVPSPTLLEQV
jgi:hypothetical protein